MSLLSTIDLHNLSQTTAPAAGIYLNSYPLPSPSQNMDSAPEADVSTLGRVLLDAGKLRALRQARLMSQQDLADDCWRRNIQVSIATIKRAEAGRAVRYRVARELARYFGLPPMQIVHFGLQQADPGLPKKTSNASPIHARKLASVK